ncbi:MAG: FMN-binding negative transcriptional regulator [Propionibacteriaceae bacterium]|nr:FMN-binding negative transcriptional regulator [Propionibacteriaceae bacterium]
MYVAKHYEIGPERLQNYLSGVRAGNLVTVHDDGPRATFVPFHLEDRDGVQVLVTHLVRNNPQATTPITGPGLVILDLADAYVSPLWYPSNEALPNVPTWDYLTIQLNGPVRVLASPEDSLAAARALTARMEQPEVLELVGEEKLHKMARAIVGVEVTVEQVRAKAKASQNRHPDDIRGVIAHLEQLGETELVTYLKEVSLPHAVERFGMIRDIKAAHRLPTSAAQ